MRNKEKHIEDVMVDRYKGCLVGSAIGDALGAPFEFMPPKKIAKRYNEIADMMGGGSFNWLAGETTDDTDQTMAVTDSILENFAIIPEDIANKFLSWYWSRPKDIGTTTSRSLSLLARGISWKYSGKLALLLGASASNGSLMRTAPVGLYLRGHADEIDKVAKEISSITHADEDCIHACQVASQLIGHLASGESKQKAIDALIDRYKYNPKIKLELLNAVHGLTRVTQFGDVFATLNVALNAFLQSDSFEEAVIKSVSAGWDTDTQATITGSFAGAYWGLDTIPSKWTCKLNPYSCTQIQEKAEKLYRLNLNL